MVQFMTIITPLSHFSKLIFFKNKPEDLPYSIVTWVALLIIPVAVLFIFNQPETRKFLLSAYCVQTSAFLLTLYFILKIQNKANRFIQTSCNFLGISLFNILILKFIVLFSKSNFLVCLFFSWIILLKIYVIEHAFNVSKLKAILYLMIFVIIPSMAVISVMPLFADYLPTNISSGGTAG